MVRRAQHAVAEHVARHIADARDRERDFGNIDIHLAEMPFHGFPGAARRDADLFVVVARRSTGREGIVEPEPVFAGDGIGKIRKCCGALVGGDHQIRIVAVMANHVHGRHHVLPSRLSVMSSMVDMKMR